MTVQQAEFERNDFNRIIKDQKDQEKKVVEMDNLRRHARSVHQDQIRIQMDYNSATKANARREHLEEGRKMRVFQADEILRLETIKAGKIADLQRSGIEQKY